MAISFDALPSRRPTQTVPRGFYKATIKTAEMKISKNTHQEYLSVMYDLVDDHGNTGKLFDMQFDSDKEFLRYKLGRFLNALNLHIKEAFELKDLCKLIKGKQLIVDVGVEEPHDGNPARNCINSFEHEIYYPMNEWAALTGAPTPEVIQAKDATDSPFTNDSEMPWEPASDPANVTSAEEY